MSGFIRRDDGSTFDTEQMRYKGRFLREYSRLSRQDYELMERQGYSREEADRANYQLNCEVARRIEAGENVSDIEKELKQVWDFEKDRFVDAD